jgi:hypothetical protein
MAQVRSMDLVKVTFIFMLSFLVIRSLPTPAQYHNNLYISSGIQFSRIPGVASSVGKYTWRYSILFEKLPYRLRRVYTLEHVQYA